MSYTHLSGFMKKKMFLIRLINREQVPEGPSSLQSLGNELQRDAPIHSMWLPKMAGHEHTQHSRSGGFKGGGPKPEASEVNRPLLTLHTRVSHVGQQLTRGRAGVWRERGTASIETKALCYTYWFIKKKMVTKTAWNCRHAQTTAECWRQPREGNLTHDGGEGRPWRSWAQRPAFKN